MASPDQNTKRIARELKELKEEEESALGFAAEPLEDDLREWHFALQGPKGTEFEGGLYHGRLTLPAGYPFAPPRIHFLTPNGRFQTGVDVCLSISAHHPEHWQPSWGIRTALMALASIMPHPGDGAIGSLDYPTDERKRLAQLSRSGPPSAPGGSAERSHLMHSLHERLLLATSSGRAADDGYTAPNDTPVRNTPASDEKYHETKSDNTEDCAIAASVMAGANAASNYGNINDNGGPVCALDEHARLHREGADDASPSTPALRQRNISGADSSHPGQTPNSASSERMHITSRGTSPASISPGSAVARPVSQGESIERTTSNISSNGSNILSHLVTLAVFGAAVLIFGRRMMLNIVSD